jgi:general secretion pathway protein G
MGFTLVELVIVIIILGILAALAIPQFTTSTDDAELATIKSNLAVLRNAIQLYYHEHGGTYPDGGEIAAQLTGYTDKGGTVNPAGANESDDTYKFGPYLLDVPDNPAVDAASQPATINSVVDTALTTVTATGGWNYHEDSGRIVANSTDHTDL